MNNLRQLVQPNLTHVWRQVRRIDRQRHKIVGALRFIIDLYSTVRLMSLCSTKASMAHRFGGNVEGPVAITVGSSGDGKTPDSHGVGSSTRRRECACVATESAI